MARGTSQSQGVEHRVGIRSLATSKVFPQNRDFPDRDAHPVSVGMGAESE